MAQAATGPAGLVDPREIVLIDGVSDERVAVASANDRFESTIAKSDLLSDDDSSAGAKRTTQNALAEEARLTEYRERLQAARAELAAYGVAIHGAGPFVIGGSPSDMTDDEDATDKKAQRLLTGSSFCPRTVGRTGKVRRSSPFFYNNLVL
jgi:hypothetical protein